MQYFYVARTEAQCLTIKNKVSAKYVDILQRIKSFLALYKPVKVVFASLLFWHLNLLDSIMMNEVLVCYH